MTAFVAFGIASQSSLAAYFVALRWRPIYAARFGWVAYAFGAVGLPLSGWLFISGESWWIWIGPGMFAAWAAFGAVVDLWRRVEWRSPVRWNVMVPYVALYFLAQMFLWRPLWDVQRVAWAVFGVLFVVNTVLNLLGHLGPRIPH